MVRPTRRLLAALLLCALTLLGAPKAFAQGATINVTQHPTLGTILTDSEGRTLYRFTKDQVNVGSACYEQCAVTWPPLLTDDNPIAGDGVNGQLLGVLTRKDGTRQVMYNGMPLYRYQRDAEAGQTNGQLVGKVWFIVHPNTTTVGNQPVTLRVAERGALGKILTDAEGRTLYLFTKDSPNLSVCYDGCATSWPPLLVGAGPLTIEGAGGTLGQTLRADGNQQVTYDGKPLYYWFRDTKPGDTTGQGVGGVWYVITPSAAPATAPAAPAAPAAAPATLPKTGDGAQSAAEALLLLALLAAVTGLCLRQIVVRGR